MNVISYSGGLGSFMAAYLLKDQPMRLVFADTKTEDEDLYRFINETSKFFGVELEVIADGRNIWEVFNDVKFMGNSRIDPCSRILKREVFDAYMDKTASKENDSIIFGIDKKEEHRCVAITGRWAPWRCEFPLVKSFKTREQILDVLDSIGIEPPRLYEMGFPHNNCGGFCVKTGQKQMKLLLETFPERYAWHEEQQEKLFTKIGPRGFIRKTIDGDLKYLSLKEFRESLDNGVPAEMWSQEGCGCFG